MAKSSKESKVTPKVPIIEKKSDSKKADIKSKPIDKLRDKLTSIKSKKAIKKKDKKKVEGKGWVVFRGMVYILTVTFMTAVGVVAGWLGYEKYGDIVNGTDGTKDTQIVVEYNDGTVVDVVEDNMASVVSIAVSTYNYNPEDGFVDVSNNIGSGFIVDASGLILTNQHVVSNTQAEYVVVTSDGEEYSIVEIQRDDVNDIALLKIDIPEDSEVKLQPVTLGDSDELKQGELVIAIGTPLGQYAGSVTTGVISGLNRSISNVTGVTSKTFENVIQTDTAINPGNSGGPLLNSDGEVVGINFATTTSADNISFAIPVNTASDRLDEYRKYGLFRQPGLGVAYDSISEYEARFYRNLVPGAVIVRVVPDSPADKAGLQKYDVITTINGESVSESLKSIILQYDIGDTITLSIWRDGEEFEVDAVLEEAK